MQLYLLRILFVTTEIIVWKISSNHTCSSDGIETNKPVKASSGACNYSVPTKWWKSSIASVHSRWNFTFWNKPIWQFTWNQLINRLIYRHNYNIGDAHKHVKAISVHFYENVTRIIHNSMAYTQVTSYDCHCYTTWLLNFRSIKGKQLLCLNSFLNVIMYYDGVIYSII